MYRLIKRDYQSSGIEVISASQNEDTLLDELCDYVRNHASNGDEYTSIDFEAIKENQREGVGSYEVLVEWVDELTDDEIITCGGGVCAHCHSSDTDCEDPRMNEGYITREILCNVCDKSTVEKYDLVGQDR